MWIGLWISLGILFLWVVFQQACLFGLNERLETLKHLHLNLDADTERRFLRGGGIKDLMERLELLRGYVDNRFNLVWEHVNQIRAVANVGVNLASRVTNLEAGKIFPPPNDLTPQSKTFVVESNPDRRMYDVDWDKLNSGYGTGDRFFSKLVTRMDELKPKVSSAGGDHRAVEVLPGSPAATIGSQANNSIALLEKMGPKPADLLRLFNAPPIICAEGAVLVKRKGV